MYSYINCDELVINFQTRKKLIQLYQKYMRHEFDLLGSGFVKVDYELQAKGVCGKKYNNPYMAQYGKKIEKKLRRHNICSDTYKPINWLVDFKSGFFFHPEKYDTRENCRSVIGKKQGVDIKCPWELGRCYHLARLAVLAVAEEKYQESVIVEFKDEVQDFIEVNPIGKTVQWSAPMDTSIRMVNLLITYDILRQLDNKGHLDCQFDIKFEKLIKESLKFVMERLECYGKTRAGGNHYLSNIVGIIFAAAYLPDSHYTNACCVFGVQELIAQVQKQFYSEGSHFEGSTSYHRLSAEFVVYATALVYGILLSNRRNIFKDYEINALKSLKLKSYSSQKYNVGTKEFFPQWYIDKLYNMGIFTKTILKQNNEIVQIGDNDNGRLVILTPMGENICENVLDHRTLLSEISGVFEHVKWENEIQEIPLEKSLIQVLAKGKKVKGTPFQKQMILGTQSDMNMEYKYTKETVLYQVTNGEKKLNDEMNVYWFNSFGVVVLRGKHTFISMVIDTAKNGKFYGHTHNDKLSIEVMVDEKYITRDPGSFVYTASPELMEKFCSVKAHNTIHVKGCEQNLMLGMWKMKRRVQAELICSEQHRIVGKVSYGKVEHYREVIITEKKIIVKDYANCPFTIGFSNKIFCSQYGKLEKVTNI